MQEKDRLLKIDEVAELLGISKHTLYKRCAPGAKDPFPITPKRVGRSVRFSESKIQQYIKER
jgi:predicted DNA-binding transcriptional regulator AlpA